MLDLNSTLEDVEQTQIPFDLFDEDIPTELILERLRNLPKPGKFNVYNPDIEFEKLFRQAVDTSDGLVDAIEEVRREMKLNDGTTTSRIKFLTTVHEILEGIGEITGNTSSKYSDDELKNLLPYIKCSNVVDHIWGTAATFLNNPFSKKDIYAIRSFNRYFLEETISKYIGSFEEAEKLIEYYVVKTFEQIIQINILNYIRNEDPERNLSKCIEIFVNKRLVGFERISELEDTNELLPSLVILKNDLPFTSPDYKLQMVIQTIVWYLIRNIKLKKFLVFKEKPVTFQDLLECYSETLVEDQNIFDEA
ncbi:MAG: hypothetical protein ACMG57_01280 [Candidatus Dojkabacteria bacterium]